MRMRSNDRAPLLFRSKPVMGIVLMAIGVTLLALGLPENWIDLAALALAAVTARPADTTPPRPPARKLRRKTRVTKRRTTRGR
ncbi:hypothetical protein ACFU9B_41440 [Streptomyces sp. NPDC057592]|uniref:hypothetical protein n=1 Tax=unclassified Streptomyces TaxID=2593676 RepID=UPI0036B84C1B